MNSGMVAWPSALTPSRWTTDWIVRNRILASMHGDAWSTYHTSKASLSGHDMALRPLTCAQPVMPGRASSRRFCSALYRSTYAIGNGRGPTRLMSPMITDQSCGSSSRLLDRRRRPSGVRRFSSGRCAPSSLRSSVIVRNFATTIGSAFLPARCCRNTTGDPWARRTTRATTTMTGDRTIPATAANATSIARRTGLSSQVLPPLIDRTVGCRW